ncbi:MAG: hypothetical protein KJN63_06645, partial [Acidimicrobiia bacterium]|nr:hypothetical protein [Acidimicrobiia bacterium]
VQAWRLTRTQYLSMLLELPEVGEAQLEAIATRFRFTMRMCVNRSDEEMPELVDDHPCEHAADRIVCR